MTPHRHNRRSRHNVRQDTAARGKFYQQAEDLLAEDVPAIPVYHYVRTHLVMQRLIIGRVTVLAGVFAVAGAEVIQE
jgi:ABC-type oligopeptide transport system substrate-binding subunit